MIHYTCDMCGCPIRTLHDMCVLRIHRKMPDKQTGEPKPAIPALEICVMCKEKVRLKLQEMTEVE